MTSIDVLIFPVIEAGPDHALLDDPADGRARIRIPGEDDIAQQQVGQSSFEVQVEGEVEGDEVVNGAKGQVLDQCVFFGVGLDPLRQDGCIILAVVLAEPYGFVDLALGVGDWLAHFEADALRGLLEPFLDAVAQSLDNGRPFLDGSLDLDGVGLLGPVQLRVEILAGDIPEGLAELSGVGVLADDGPHVESQQITGYEWQLGYTQVLLVLRTIILSAASLLLFLLARLLALREDYCLLLRSAYFVLCGVALRGRFVGLRAGRRFVDLWQLGCDFFEELLDVGSGLCADLLEDDHVAVGEVLALRLRDIPILQIHLIPKQRNDDPIAPLILDIVDPLLHALEGGPIGDIVDHNGDGGVSDVIGDQGFESLLASGVPKLQPDGLILKEDVLGDEVYADGRALYGDTGTCQLPSKMSQMKRFMIEDLPTAWSPRKTILYFKRGGIVPFDRFRLLMFVMPDKSNTQNIAWVRMKRWKDGQGGEGKMGGEYQGLGLAGSASMDQKEQGWMIQRSSWLRSSLERKPFLVVSKQLCGSSSQSTNFEETEPQKGHFSSVLSARFFLSYSQKQPRQTKFKHQLQARMRSKDSVQIGQQQTLDSLATLEPKLQTTVTSSLLYLVTNLAFF